LTGEVGRAADQHRVDSDEALALGCGGIARDADGHE
jgi:hypothetical protein